MAGGKNENRTFSHAPLPASSGTAEKQLIAIGASTGGTEAIAAIFKDLAPPLPPIVVVQHIPPLFSGYFSRRLDAISRISVKEAEDGDVLQSSYAYVAPGGQHMKVVRQGGRLALACAKGDPVNWVCPSVDVLFFSVAEIVGPAAVGVILTGMGADGAKGLFAMRRKGALTFGQDAASSVVYGMPRAAFELGSVERQMPLAAIAGAIRVAVRG